MPYWPISDSRFNNIGTDIRKFPRPDPTRTLPKVRELLKLGTYLKTAIFAAISRKGPWHLARTLATQTGMINQWLKEKGLVSVKDLWVHPVE